MTENRWRFPRLRLPSLRLPGLRSVGAGGSRSGGAEGSGFDNREQPHSLHNQYFRHEEIDAALALLAQAQPAAGLEQRIHLNLTARIGEDGPVGVRQPSLVRRIADAVLAARQAGRRPNTLFPLKSQRLALALIAATVVSAGMFAYRGYRTSSAPTALPALRAPMHPAGIGTAAAIRISPQPAKPSLRLHPRATPHSSHGRAQLGVLGHRKPLPPGVAVPRSPAAETAPATPQP